MDIITQSHCLKLNDFLLNFIEIQIAKCLRIVKLGVGPNSAQSAMLVKEQANALLKLAYDFHNSMITKKDINTTYRHILRTIKFYLDQEIFRIQAAIFASDNPPHREAEKQAIIQQSRLKHICDDCKISYDDLIDYDYLPVNLSQFRVTSARLSLKDIELILGNSTQKVNEVVASIIKENSAPNGYYDQKREQIIQYKLLCQHVIQHIESQAEVIEIAEPLSLEQAESDLQIWNQQIEVLHSFVLETIS